ncbi:MAG: metalloprotease [Chlorobi bacterium]|nr:metalloprotease [Chlorobiota bacterium]
MLWKGRRQSANVEDRRGSAMPARFAGGGIGTLVILLLVWLLGGNPLDVLQSLDAPPGSSPVETSAPQAAGDSRREFVAVVLADTEDVWGALFRDQGMSYRPPKLVLFSTMVQSACGLSQAATGPFYCPGDEKVYIDLDFLEDLQQRLHAKGDFAVAYIIAHEVGHHVQKQLGITRRVMALQDRVSEAEFNRSMVRLELQADFFAGVWAHHAKRLDLLEAGDLEEAVNAAAAVGDDRIQKQTQGYVVPDSFTHGTSEQRKRWFYKGYETGDITRGDTFSAAGL